MEEMKKRFDETFGYEISEMRKEYKSYLSKPEDITSFIQSEIDLAVSKERERIVEIIKSTQNKYHGTDKKTKEKTYSGGGACRQCSKRRDSLEIEEILNIINTK